MRTRLVRKIVGQLVETIEPSRRGARKRAERSDARDADGRADWIGRRRLQVAVRELAARLVHGARGNGRDVARGESVIGAVESRGGGRCIQRAGRARILTVHAVDTVARAKEIFGVELMVKFAEKALIMYRVWIQACGNGAAGISGNSQASVDYFNTSGRDRDQPALVQQALFEIREVESAVLDDRPAETRAVLRLRQRQFRVRERV